MLLIKYNTRYKNFISITIVLCLTAVAVFAEELPDTSKTKCYNGIVEIPCPKLYDDSQSQDAQKKKAPPKAEPFQPYTDLGNGIIQDNANGRMWQKATAPGIGSGDFPDRYNWEQANTYCANLSLGGYSDWRLPEVNELQSLVDYNRGNPSINTALFSGTIAARYWTSTAFANSTNSAWYVSFYYGYVRNCVKTSHYYVRAVRSGQ